MNHASPATGRPDRSCPPDAPLLSILIPAYNAEATLPRTLESIKRLVAPEHHRRLQVVMIDDGSEDSTPSIMHNNLPDSIPRTILAGNHRGVSAARNLGLQSSEGNFLLFLDADDELAADPIAFLLQHSHADLIVTSTEYKRKGRLVEVRRPAAVSSGNIARLLSAGNPFAISSLMFRRECIDQPFSESRTHLEDWEFWSRNPRIFNGLIAHSDQAISTIHIHDNNASRNVSAMGQGRATFAAAMLAEQGSQLNYSARNNWRIQQAIGELQASMRRVRLSTFTHLPCSPRLYAKLVIHSTYALFNKTASRYS
ncbi:MAG: glycosyltransferase family 2 protein [Rubinisphaera brasiliensis]|uniref:glycosyltransferase family 2 protein n=1 Tax=Rubinisphaera brasiliensis TaxID=119 RepID=UPI00391D7992